MAKDEDIQDSLDGQFRERGKRGFDSFPGIDFPPLGIDLLKEFEDVNFSSFRLLP